LKKTLREHREVKQLTQHDLSDKSSVSVRTIQRIEKNLSVGSPFVIKSLCKALEIDIDSLEINKQETSKLLEGEINDDQIHLTTRLKHINFSSLLVLIFPLFNLVFPILLYWIYRKTLINKQIALQIINFQIIWTFGTMIIIIVTPAIVQEFYGLREYSGYPLFVWLYFFCIFTNILITYDTAIKLNKREGILPYIPTIL
jgi:transcriptional regulator with XRE-family HTH domain